MVNSSKMSKVAVIILGQLAAVTDDEESKTTAISTAESPGQCAPETQHGSGLLHVPSIWHVALVASAGNTFKSVSQLKLHTDPSMAPSEQLTEPKSNVPRSGHIASARHIGTGLLWNPVIIHVDVACPTR